MAVAEACKNLYEKIFSFENLYQAFLKARKYKRYNQEMLEFEYNLEKELFKLKEELHGLTYEPLEASKRFIVYEPARREIIIPAFRDRIVQQALLQVIEPVFEKSFIYDSYAFRIGKGTHSALERFDKFKRKVSPRRFPSSGHILKADIKDYYPSVDHNILIRILKEKIADEEVIGLIEKILSICPGDKGIAVGSPCSQLFANIYLNKLDYFVKHNLRKKFYLRYCDDFVVLDRSYRELVDSRKKIEDFLRGHLKLQFHPQKTKYLRTNQGVDLLGFRVFYFHRLVRRKNHRAFRRNLKLWQEEYGKGSLSASKLGERIRGWISYAEHGNSMNIKELIKDIDTRSLRRSSLNIYPTDYCNRRCVFCKLAGVLTTQEDRNDMTMEGINTIIDFCKRSGVNQLRILGGESSQHPQIVDLIERIYERGLYVGIIFTNGIFDNDELIKSILRHSIPINMNYFPKEEYRDGQLELVHENMKRLFLKNSDLKGMVGQKLMRDTGAVLSITFYKPDQEYQYIIDACLKYGVDRIRWAASHSSTTQENRHVHFGLLRQMVPLMVNFVRDAIRAGISTCIECGLVPCMLTKQEYRFLSRFTADFRFRCEPILDVFPDLSVHYCMGMPIVSRITKKNTLSQILLEQMIISEHFRRRPRTKACLKCEWWKGKICDGYCLQYKYDRCNPEDRKLLAGLDWIEDRKQKSEVKRQKG